MLWYKSWLETRWRFIAGAAVLTLSAAGTVFAYPQVVKLLPMVSTAGATGEIGRRIREGAELSRDFRGYIWWQVFKQNLPQMGTLFAALLGTGGLLQQSAGGAALFTLSLPVSRTKNLGVRAVAGLAEWAAIAFAPAIVIVLVAPAIGQRYGTGEALVQSLCLFVGGALFYSLAFLLSTSYTDLWRPLLITCAAGVALAVAETLSHDLGGAGVYHLMAAEDYFRTGQLPWLGVLISGLLSAALLSAAAANMARRDF